MGFPVISTEDRQPSNTMGVHLPDVEQNPIDAQIRRRRGKIGSGAPAPLLLPILYVKRVFLFPGLALPSGLTLLLSIRPPSPVKSSF